MVCALLLTLGAVDMDVERIRAHLSHVEMVLRARGVDDPERLRNLDRLHAYWVRGQFPHNHHVEGLTPVFIDEHGTACAVGQLIIDSGDGALAERIAREQRLSYLPDIHTPGLAEWVARSGLTAEELAWIQPSYAGCHDICEGASEGRMFHFSNGAWTATSNPALVGPVGMYGRRDVSTVQQLWGSWAFATRFSSTRVIQYDGNAWSEKNDFPSCRATSAATGAAERCCSPTGA